MSDRCEAEDGKELVVMAAKSLVAINPKHELLRFFKETETAQTEAELETEFYKRFAKNGQRPVGVPAVAYFWGNFFIALRDARIEELKTLLVGKKVRITTTVTRTDPREDMCTCVHEVNDERIDVELGDGSRHGLQPSTFTNNVLEGKISPFIAGTCRVEILPA